MILKGRQRPWLDTMLEEAQIGMEETASWFSLSPKAIWLRLLIRLVAKSYGPFHRLMFQKLCVRLRSSSAVQIFASGSATYLDGHLGQYDSRRTARPGCWMSVL